MIGIYKITNKLNDNCYIGLSIDIERRWHDHQNRYQNINSAEYNKALYRAMRKYGIDNFQFEILELCNSDDLCSREQYWIAYYDSYKNGYNETPGGDIIDTRGEKHPNHKLTKEDVIYIRQLWASKTISTKEMYYEFANKIGKSGFKKIYTWQTWKDILPELNTQENRDWHRNNIVSYSNIGEHNPNCKITDKEFQDIQQRYQNGESLRNIYLDYKNIYKNLKSFQSCFYARNK